jgi:hypothetical protein
VDIADMEEAGEASAVAADFAAAISAEEEDFAADISGVDFVRTAVNRPRSGSRRHIGHQADIPALSSLTDSTISPAYRTTSLTPDSAPLSGSGIMAGNHRLRAASIRLTREIGITVAGIGATGAGTGTAHP